MRVANIGEMIQNIREVEEISSIYLLYSIQIAVNILFKVIKRMTFECSCHTHNCMKQVWLCTLVIIAWWEMEGGGLQGQELASK